MMEDDQFDGGEEFAEDPSEDEEDIQMDESNIHTPRLALEDLFRELAYEQTSPFRKARPVTYSSTNAADFRHTEGSVTQNPHTPLRRSRRVSTLP